MKIKGIEFTFYCPRCKGVLRDSISEKPVENLNINNINIPLKAPKEFYCDCQIRDRQVNRNKDKFNGTRLNKR